jgi:hypothetical protein
VFQLNVDPFRPDLKRYVHANCNKAKGAGPTALPVRLLVACEQGQPPQAKDSLGWTNKAKGCVISECKTKPKAN